MRRIVSVIVTVLGLAAIVLAVCSATVWKPSSTVEASLAQSPGQPYVVTEPGVLAAVNTEVTVTATAPGEDDEVTVIVARAADVKAWLANDPYVSVTGLGRDLSTLTVTDVTETCGEEASDAAGQDDGAQDGAEASAGSDCVPREASGKSPVGSDLWIDEHTGTSEVSFTYSATSDQTIVMAVTDGQDQAPDLTLSWERAVPTPWYFYAGLIVGGLMFLVGVFLFLIDVQVRHADSQRRTRAAERAARIANADSVTTVGLPQLDDPNRKLTRRELRDKERAEAAGREWVDPRTGRAGGAGSGAGDGGASTQAAPGALGERPWGSPAPEGGGQAGGEPGTWPGWAGSAPQEAAVEQGAAQGDEAVAFAAGGAARGSAVVPGLAQTAAEAHRAARELESQEPFSVASQGEGAPAAQDGGAGTDPFTAPGGHDGSDTSRFAPPWQAGWGEAQAYWGDAQAYPPATGPGGETTEITTEISAVSAVPGYPAPAAEVADAAAQPGLRQPQEPAQQVPDGDADDGSDLDFTPEPGMWSQWEQARAASQEPPATSQAPGGFGVPEPSPEQQAGWGPEPADPVLPPQSSAGATAAPPEQAWPTQAEAGASGLSAASAAADRVGADRSAPVPGGSAVRAVRAALPSVTDLGTQDDPAVAAQVDAVQAEPVAPSSDEAAPNHEEHA